MKTIEGIPVWGDVDESAFSQIKNCAKTADAAALMADQHKGYAVPIGGVLAYYEHISPSGVGFDIACGNKAVLIDIPAAEIRKNIRKILDDIWHNLAFGIGQKNNIRVDHPLFDDPAWKLRAVAPHKKMAQEQLGTIGSGNHYVDLLEDEQGRAWIGVHFGSRGLGHKTATYFLEAGGAKDGMDVDPLILSFRSSLGEDYLTCMELAGRYAYAGRNWVCDEVARLLRANILEEVHNNHNYCIPGDAIIPTPDGPKRMQELKTGDAVYAFDEKQGVMPVPVKEHWLTGEKPLINIKTASRSLNVSPEHPILTIQLQELPHPTRPWHTKHQGELVWKIGADISAGDIIVCAESYYPEKLSIGVGMARLIGAMLGDGWVRHNPKVQGYAVGLAIGTAEQHHTTRYKQLLEIELPEANWKIDQKGAYGLTCSSVKVWKTLQELGLTEYGNDKYVPPIAFSLPRSEKMALLAGYFDSDGSISNANTSNHGRGVITSTNKVLVDGLRELAISCGLQVTPIHQRVQKTNFAEAVIYRCTLSADSAALLDVWHQGKAANQRKTIYNRNYGLQPSKIGYLKLPKGAFAQRVMSVSIDSHLHPVFDLTIDHPSHTFICEGVVVHNCWRENHNGQDMWVIRKGATPAFPGQRGFVGGSMGDISVILEGVDSDESKTALYSTVHGAGRVMSRTAARGKINRKTGQVISPGAVSREMMLAWVHDQHVELRGAGTDESPHCYKRLPEVLQHHSATVRILHTLKPMGVAMAGEHEFDPYKD